MKDSGEDTGGSNNLTKSKNLTEGLIQYALMIDRDRYRRNLVVPNFTPFHWWECDLFEVTKAGYFVEYEIKISRSDFMSDKKKYFPGGGTWEDGQFQPCPDKFKHDLLSMGSIQGPSRFYFVTPPGLVRESEIPEFAGLIEVGEFKSAYQSECSHVKTAPRLHKDKVAESVATRARTDAYRRYISMLVSGGSNEVSRLLQP